jgi:hypothetical protein
MTCPASAGMVRNEIQNSDYSPNAKAIDSFYERVLKKYKSQIYRLEQMIGING